MSANLMPLLLNESVSETRLARVLEDACRAEIDRRDPAEVCNLLELAAPGLTALLWQTEWPTARAIRVADALGIFDSVVTINVREGS